MKISGIELVEGSDVKNLTISSGASSFPSNPNNAELFYRTDDDTRVVGLYLYISGAWQRLASHASVSIPSGTALPALANIGDVFYRTGGVTGLYVYTGLSWTAVVGTGSGGTIAAVYDAPFVPTVVDGSTVLQLDDSYAAGTSSVWVGGLRQKRGVDYAETSSTELTLNFAVTSDDVAAGMNVVVDYIAA